MDADQINWEPICDGGADTTALVDGDFTRQQCLSILYAFGFSSGNLHVDFLSVFIEVHYMFLSVLQYCIEQVYWPCSHGFVNSPMCLEDTYIWDIVYTTLPIILSARAPLRLWAI